MSEPRLAFGPFAFDSSNSCLLRDGKPLTIGQRGIAVLRALLDAEGQIVTKPELLELAWPGLIVEEGNLAVQVAALRKALGPGPQGREWIATVPRVGYRLALSGEAGLASEPYLPSIAVLPFQNMSSDPEQDYFADGIVEDIITELSRFRSFATVARNSSFVYRGRAVDVRQVARELGVRYVLEGSVQRNGQLLRIGAQLIDGTTGTHLWGEKFDRPLEAIFDIQDRITQSVVATMEPTIRQAEIERARRKSPQSVDAYDLYLQALPHLRNERAEDNAEAIAFLERALALAPTFAGALAKAAQAYEHRLSMGWPPLGNDRQRSLELAAAALDVAGDDAAVLATCGLTTLIVGRNYEQGLLILERAFEVNPNSIVVLHSCGIGHLLGGDLDKAQDFFRRAMQLAPEDPALYFRLTGTAHAQLALDQYEAALLWARRSLVVNANFDPTHWIVIAANAHLGRVDEAKRALAAYLVNVPGATLFAVRRGQHAREPHRIDVVLQGLRLAGMPET